MQGKLIKVPDTDNCIYLRGAVATTADLPPPINSLTPQSSMPMVMNIKPDPDAEKPVQILKQAITPIGGKPNILKLLNNYKSSSNKGEVFKTIGNRIVIPMKVSISTKKLAAIKSMNSQAKGKQSSTFQMALSSNQFPKNSFHAFQKNRTQLSSSNGLHRQKELFQPSITVRSSSFTNDAENCKSSSTTAPLGSEVCDESNFTTSVSSDIWFSALRNDDQDSAVSSTDSSKLNLSVATSKLSDFDEILDEDNDLTCLSWLSGYNKQLFDTIRKCNPDDPGIGMSGDEMEHDNGNLSSSGSVFLASSPVTKQTSAHDVKYNPMEKPPYSFSCLIFMAIEDSYLKRLPVKDIYVWVCKHFPYFQMAPSGWKNSVRHNLSMNRCFKKANCKKDSAKGSLWCIDPAYRPNLVQALKRNPFYPYLHGIGQPLSLNNLGHLLPGTHAGRVQSWGPALSPTTLWADPDMASAALNLMGLRGNEREVVKSSESINNTLEEIFRDAKWGSDQDNKFLQRSESYEPVIIRGANQDHCYTSLPAKKKIKREDSRCHSPDSEKSAPDAAYEFETVGFSEDELEDEMMQGVMNEVVIDDEENEADEQGLFDSGFGSMKDFVVKNKKMKSNNQKEPQTKKHRTSKKRPSKTASDSLTKKSHVSKLNSIKLPVKSRTNKKRCERLKSHTSNSKPKMKKVKEESKKSDVDSGKDSPKVDRSSRSRRFKQRSEENTSRYHTRSSGNKLSGQDPDNGKMTMLSNRRRKRSTSNRGETTDEEEEVKRAAGSLLRLAGLLKSPTNLSRAATK